MEILLIRHGESLHNIGATNNLDCAITENGMSQTCQVAEWLAQEFDLTGYVGVTSPYLRTLQTASVIREITGTPFVVNSGIRETYVYNKHEPDLMCDGGLNVVNRSLLFANIQWPNEYWGGEDHKFFPVENVSAFVDRMKSFLYHLKNRGYEKYVLVTHGSPVRAIRDLALGMEPAKLKEEYGNFEKILDQFKDGNPRKIHNCGLTWIKDGTEQWFSRVVYEEFF